MRTFYNDSDAYCAAWLRNLIGAGALPAGVVSDRSIEEIDPAALDGFEDCHFFAGIGGWPHALELARWPAGRPVWTGSAPCQPFSDNGYRLGAADRRHIWPAFFRLIEQRRPPTIFGEQVAGELGCEWLAAVRLDLEGIGYAVGAADLPAASVGAPHQRQRLYWVAHAAGERGDQAQADSGNESPLGMADAAGRRRVSASSGFAENVKEDQGFWEDAVWLPGVDGRSRPCKPGLSPLADGVSGGVGPARAGRNRGYGNAIVPQVAAAFIRAFLNVSNMEGM